MAVEEKFDELDWVQVREDLDKSFAVETVFEKAKRKIGENPLVPIGSIATTAALSYGLYNFYVGDKRKQQYMMRARVGAQTFTIICMIVGILLLPKDKGN